MSNNEKYIYPPTSAQLKSELERINHKKEKRRMMNGILVALLAVAAAAGSDICAFYACAEGYRQQHGAHSV